MKTATEILDDYGCPEIPFNENITMLYPAIINAMEEYAKNLALDFVVWKDSQYKNIDCFYSDEELFLLFQKTR